MRYTSSWFDQGASPSVAATRPCISMVAVGIFIVAALALGWATIGAAYDELAATGQTTCYLLERYPATTDPDTGEVIPGDPIVRDANGVPELDSSGQPTPTCDVSPGPGCFDPNTGSVTDQVVRCTGTGQDGESQKGITRLRKDKGDGRIYDNNTGLTWAKKSDDDGLHDKDNTYTWDEAFAYIHTMNNTCHLSQGAPPAVPTPCATNADCPAVGDKCGFAGKRDWRLPNIRELGSIVNFGVFSDLSAPTPTVYPEFNTNCVPGVTVLTGSCIHADSLDNAVDANLVPVGTPDSIPVPYTYWSSTTGDIPGDAWFTDFTTGDNGAHFKDTDIDIDTTDPAFPSGVVAHAGLVRAVRGPGDDDPAPKPAPTPKKGKKK